MPTVRIPTGEGTLRSSWALWAVLCGAMLIGLATPGLSEAHFVQSSYAFGANACVVANRSDPVTMIFYGFPATSRNVDTEVQRQAGWIHHTGGDQWLQSHGLCNHFDVQDADQITLNRFHTRLWQMPGLDLKNRFITYATPHHEDFVVLGGCGFPGNHAVDENGSLGSGFDQGRNRLTGEFVAAGYSIGDVQFWGNTQTFRQCDGGDASSDGKVNWINFDRLR
jgi:hypothetical protein